MDIKLPGRCNAKSSIWSEFRYTKFIVSIISNLINKWQQNLQHVFYLGRSKNDLEIRPKQTVILRQRSQICTLHATFWIIFIFCMQQHPRRYGTESGRLGEEIFCLRMWLHPSSFNLGWSHSKSTGYFYGGTGKKDLWLSICAKEPF